MGKFSLSRIYVVCNALLDGQHKLILSYMAKVYSYLLAEKKGKDLFELLDQLHTYFKLHIWDEEKIMEEMEFPYTEDR